MRVLPLVAAAVVAAGCGRRGADERAAADRKDAWAPPAAARPCQAQPFTETLALAEASGATWLEVDGRAAVLVVSDSGSSGAYALVDPVSGDVRERGALPLGDGAGDDLESVSAMDGQVWGLTSAGWMRAWRRVAGGFALVDGPYPIAVDPAPGAPGVRLMCPPRHINCGKNFEALCLRPGAQADGACLGFAGSRRDGRLWCLVRDGARVVADASRSIAVAPAMALSSCDFSPDGETLWAGSNLFDAAHVYHVDGWREPARARAVLVDGLGAGFPEGMAIGPDDTVYRFSDVGGATSSQWKFRCEAAAR